MTPLDIVGQKFNKLLCLERVEGVKKHSYFLFLCDCGEKVKFMGTLVKMGYRVSCNACARQTTKRYRDHPLYDVWKGMKARCYGKNNISYKNYGARGVQVCDEWRNDFKAFYDWCLANEWEEGLRIDKDYKSTCNGMLYSPDDCCIISHKKNSQKTRRIKLDEQKVAEIRQSELPSKKLAEKYGVHYTTIRYVKKYKTWN